MHMGRTANIPFRATSLLATIAVLLCACEPASPTAEKPARDAAAPQTRAEPPDLIFIGLDGADWKQIDRLIEQGRLPNLASLKRRGVYGRLDTHVPSLSPALWTTIATGTLRERHGIEGFFEEDPQTGERTPYRSDMRRTPAFWNMLDARGRSSLVIYWWNTWPAEAIRGAVVSDFLFFSRNAIQRGHDVDNDTLLAGAVHPPALLPRVLEHLRRAERLPTELAGRILELPPHELKRFVDDVEHRLGKRPNGQSLSVLKNKLIESEFHLELGLSLIAEQHYDAYIYYSKGIDAAGHMFWPFYEPEHPEFTDARPRAEDVARYRAVIPNFYAYEDSNIGRILEAAGPDAYVLIVSDHGHHAAGHDDGPDGIFLLSGPGILPGVEVTGIALEDIAPLVLHLLGEPVEAGLDGRVPLQVFEPSFRAAHPVETLQSEFATPKTPTTPHTSGRGLQPALEAELRVLGYIDSGSDSQPEPTPQATTTR